MEVKYTKARVLQLPALPLLILGSVDAWSALEHGWRGHLVTSDPTNPVGQ
jgi:hypothetical protein